MIQCPPSATRPETSSDSVSHLVNAQSNPIPPQPRIVGTGMPRNIFNICSYDHMRVLVQRYSEKFNFVETLVKKHAWTMDSACLDPWLNDIIQDYLTLLRLLVLTEEFLLKLKDIEEGGVWGPTPHEPQRPLHHIQEVTLTVFSRIQVIDPYEKETTFNFSYEIGDFVLQTGYPKPSDVELTEPIVHPQDVMRLTPKSWQITKEALEMTTYSTPFPNNDEDHIVMRMVDRSEWDGVQAVRRRVARCHR